MLSLELTASDLEVVLKEKDHHPHFHVRRKLLVLHLKNLGFSTEQICKIVTASSNTIRSYIKEYNTKGINSITSTRFHRPVSELKNHETLIKASFREKPPLTLLEAKHKIKELTGVERSLTQVRVFLKSIGL